MIPLKLREEMANDPYYKRCARQSLECGGRLTWEHACYYAGRKIQEKWAIIPLCERHHGLGKWHNNGGLLNKRINRQIAEARATEEDKAKYPRYKWTSQ